MQKGKEFHLTDPVSRRQFLGVAAVTTFILPSTLGLRGKVNVNEPLFDWKLWEKFRDQVVHPALTIREEDIENALTNKAKFEWAAHYVNNIEQLARKYLHHIQTTNLTNLIEETTPGDPLWTPCPSCRDLGKPVYPHRLWDWSIEAPNQLKCTIGGETFPNVNYPEDIILKSQWGKPQQLTFYSGEPFVIFGFKEGRPSFSANIRARKVQWAANYARVLAEAYILTGQSEFAENTRNILLRFMIVTLIG